MTLFAPLCSTGSRETLSSGVTECDNLWASSVLVTGDKCIGVAQASGEIRGLAGILLLDGRIRISFEQYPMYPVCSGCG